jgi:hypothetical protein
MHVEEAKMRGLLKFLHPKRVDVPPRETHTLEDATPAPSPVPELDETLRKERGKFMEEVVKFEDTARNIRMALSRKTLDIRTRPH